MEKNLLTNDTDTAGEYDPITEDYDLPRVTRGPALVTSNSGPLSKDRHILQSSTGNTVIARSSGADSRSRPLSWLPASSVVDFWHSWIESAKIHARMSTVARTGVDYLISADKDLLDLGEYEGIPVLSAPAFLGLLERGS